MFLTLNGLVIKHVKETKFISVIIDERGWWDMSFLSILRENSQRVILKNYFWVFLSNGKIVYYQDVPQLTVPLNTLHTLHLKVYLSLVHCCCI